MDGGARRDTRHMSTNIHLSVYFIRNKLLLFHLKRSYKIYMCSCGHNDQNRQFLRYAPGTAFLTLSSGGLLSTLWNYTGERLFATDDNESRFLHFSKGRGSLALLRTGLLLNLTQLPLPASQLFLFLILLGKHWACWLESPEQFNLLHLISVSFCGG